MYSFTTVDAANSTGADTELLGINNFGEAVGGSSYSFVYSDGVLTPLINLPVGGGATGGINDAGQLVGLFTDGTGTHGFLDTNGTFTTIDVPSATVSENGDTATEAYGINNLGQIVGIDFGPGYWNSFLDTKGTFTTITDPVAYFNPSPPGDGTISGGGTFATGINDAGQIVGYYFNSSGVYFGFVDTGGSFVTISDPAASTDTYGSGTMVSGINDAGQIVGSYFDSSGIRHGFLYSDGTFTTIDLPSVGSGGLTGINNQGDIVGFAGSDGFEATPVPCFLTGTQIATRRGKIPVEALAIGDLVQAQYADFAAVKWIERRRVYCNRHPKPQKVWPVRVRSDTFDAGVPHRDVWLSPDHAVAVGDVLIPIRLLINGITIEQVPVDEVTYYHIELLHHDVLLAEGLPVESYLDTGDRFNFQNDGGPIALYAEFSARRCETAFIWEALGCSPLIVTGPELDAVRQLVNSRAEAVVHAASAA